MDGNDFLLCEFEANLIAALATSLQYSMSTSIAALSTSVAALATYIAALALCLRLQHC
jgi:hypothetical protein